MRCFCGYVGGYPIFRCPACHRLLINPSQVKEGVPAPWGFVVRAMARTLSKREWDVLPDVLPDGTPKVAIWYRCLGPVACAEAGRA